MHFNWSLTQTGNAQKQYSLPNIHGDTLLTADAAGTNTSTGNGPANSFTYDPYGNVLPGSVLPANTSIASYGWVGQHEKLSESMFALTPMQMGVRVYIPGIARFLQVDPIDGGTPNAYVYPPDPINDFDLTGEFSTWGVAQDYFGPSKTRIMWGMAGAAISVARGGSFGTGYDRGTMGHDIVGTVATLGVGGSGALVPRVIKTGSGAARNLRESLAIREAMGASRGAKSAASAKGIKDPRLIGSLWKKMTYNTKYGTQVHYLQNKILPFLQRQYKINRR